jgi:RHS repeat-associated protein
MKKLLFYIMFLGTLTQVSGQVFQDYNVFLTKNDLFINPDVSMGEGQFKIENNIISLNFMGASVVSNTLRTGVIKALNTTPALPDMVLGPITSPTLGATNYIVSIENGNLVFTTTNNSEQFDLSPESGSINISQETDLTHTFSGSLPTLYTCTSGGSGGGSGNVTISNGIVTITYSGGWSPSCNVVTGPILNVGGGDGIELGRLKTQGGVNTLYKLKIENDFLHIYFDDEYREPNPTSAIINISLQTNLTHTFSNSIPTLYECQGVAGSGGGSGNLNIENGLVELNYSGGWSSTCNIKTGFLMDAGGGDGIELGEIETAQGIKTIYQLKIDQGQLHIYTDAEVYLVKDYFFNFSQLLSNQSGSAVTAIPKPNLPVNFVMQRGYDVNGVLRSGSINFFDNLGRTTQQQSKDFRTARNWSSETRYDQLGRAALTTLAAPVSQSPVFHIKNDFITTQSGQRYDNNNFELNPETPEIVGTQESTLGWYYSSQNTDGFYEGNDYQDVTEYPFARTIYSELNPGSALRTLGGNKQDGEWKQGYTFSMKAGDELSQVGAFNDLSYSSLNRKVLKTVSRDVHGVENVLFTDTDGKTLAAARSGGVNTRSSTVLVGEQGFVDIHVPQYTTGFTVNKPSNINIEIFDLITEGYVGTSSSALPNGFYRVAITNLEDYNVGDVSITYSENYYDYSLNLYDDLGRLTSSKQPLNHLETTYEYNTLGQLIRTTSPDEGTAEFKYRNDGQIRYSQNTKQQEASPQHISYTNYDYLGRPVESGVVLNNNFNTLDPDTPSLPTGTKIEQYFTQYDTVDTNELIALGLPLAYQNPSFLGKNVAKTSNNESTTYYSYDIYGRVKWVVQVIAGLNNPTTIDYEYDPITGQVTKVYYQKDVVDETFIHRYTYDAIDNSLTKVETSTDDEIFRENASYSYFETGGLRNIVLAGGIQQTDYVYNLTGQLKAINHPDLSPNSDPGGSTDDIFGMTIDYYTDDYKRNSVFGNLPTGTGEYNGNIKRITWNTATNLNPVAAQYTYNYNRNNWLTDATFNEVGDTQGTTDYQVSNITYDANGNIQTLNRNKNTENNRNEMDVLTYNYDTLKPNQLKQVQDAVTLPTNADDIKYQSSADNYQYNSIGQLVKNLEEDVEYFYNSSGLVTEVKKDGTTRVKFYYNDRNHRVKKESYTPSGVNTTYYVRDLSGSPMAIYNNNILAENPIYGASRVGIHYRTAGQDAYQLTDHLGNVRAVLLNTGGVTGVYTTNFDNGSMSPWTASANATSVGVENGRLKIVTKKHLNGANGYYDLEAGKNYEISVYADITNFTVPLEFSIWKGSSKKWGDYYVTETGTVSTQFTPTETGTYRLNFRMRQAGYAGDDHTVYIDDVIINELTTQTMAITNTTDYYPFGMPMPGRRFVDGEPYRYGYQGEFAEKDPETGMEAFELRLWDSRIGRWLTPDPYGEFYSPYLGMGNNPMRLADPDGGITFDIILKGLNDSSLTISAPGDPIVINVDKDFGGHRTVDLGIKALEDIVIGYQVAGNGSIGVGYGGTLAGNITVATFFDKDYAGYWYAYAGAEGTAELGINTTASANIDGSLIVGIRNENGKHGPSAFSGNYALVSGTLGIETWLAADLFYQKSIGEHYSVHEIGFSVGLEAAPTLVRAFGGAGVGKSILLDKQIPTKDRTWWDVISNQWFRNPIVDFIFK